MQHDNRKGIVPGIILIGLGILFFLKNYNIEFFDWFPLGLGLLFIISYYTKRKSGFLITGIILTSLGTLILLMKLHFIDSNQFSSLFFIMMGAGFLVLYFVKKKAGFIFPGFIFPAIGGYNFILGFDGIKEREIWPLIFMMLSVAFLLIFIMEFKKYGYGPLFISILFFCAGSMAFLAVREIITREMVRHFFTMSRKFWPILLVIAGVLVIFKNKSLKTRDNT